jgi:tetratricopeptide (TPR) repeat protein
VNAALDAAMRMGLSVTRTHAMVLSAELAIDAGFPQDALNLPTHDKELFRAPRMKGWAVTMRANAALALGQLQQAETLYREAIALLGGAPALRGRATAGLAQACLQRGRLDEALAHSRAAVDVLGEGGSVDGGEEASCARLVGNAERIAQPELRESYLHGVRANRDIFALAGRLADRLAGATGG